MGRSLFVFSSHSLFTEPLRKIIFTGTKTGHIALCPEIGCSVTLLVLLMGIEPTRCFHRGILSPLRLPVPPQQHTITTLFIIPQTKLFVKQKIPPTQNKSRRYFFEWSVNVSEYQNKDRYIVERISSS